MAAPAGGVFAAAVSPRLRGVEDGFDASPDATGSLGLVCPDRFQNLEDVPCADVGNRHVTHHGIDVSSERVTPLLPVLVVAPTVLISSDVGLSDVLKGDPGYAARLSCRKSLSGLPLALL